MHECFGLAQKLVECSSQFAVIYDEKSGCACQFRQMTFQLLYDEKWLLVLRNGPNIEKHTQDLLLINMINYVFLDLHFMHVTNWYIFLSILLFVLLVEKKPIMASMLVLESHG